MSVSHVWYCTIRLRYKQARSDACRLTDSEAVEVWHWRRKVALLPVQLAHASRTAAVRGWLGIAVGVVDVGGRVGIGVRAVLMCQTLSSVWFFGSSTLCFVWLSPSGASALWFTLAQDVAALQALWHAQPKAHPLVHCMADPGMQTLSARPAELQAQTRTPEHQAQSRCKARPSNGPRPYWHSRPPCAATRYSRQSLDLAARSASQSPSYSSGLQLPVPAKPCPTLHMRASATATCCIARKTCA